MLYHIRVIYDGGIYFTVWQICLEWLIKLKSLPILFKCGCDQSDVLGHLADIKFGDLIINTK